MEASCKVTGRGVGLGMGHPGVRKLVGPTSFSLQDDLRSSESRGCTVQQLQSNRGSVSIGVK
jgi:hypothetical protein